MMIKKMVNQNLTWNATTTLLLISLWADVEIISLLQNIWDVQSHTDSANLTNKWYQLDLILMCCHCCYCALTFTLEHKLCLVWTGHYTAWNNNKHNMIGTKKDSFRWHFLVKGFRKFVNTDIHGFQIYVCWQNMPTELIQSLIPNIWQLCLCVQSLKPRFLVNWRTLVEGRIANIGI